MGLLEFHPVEINTVPAFALRASTRQVVAAAEILGSKINEPSLANWI